MYNYDDLIARLRKGTGLPVLQAMMDEAANAIEELRELLDEANHNYDLAVADVERLTQMVGKTEQLKWISAEELLPEPETDVIVCFDDGEVCSLWQNWTTDKSWDEPLTYFKDAAMEDTHKVTHWMPLPEPPKEE